MTPASPIPFSEMSNTCAAVDMTEGKSTQREREERGDRETGRQIERGQITGEDRKKERIGLLLRFAIVWLGLPECDKKLQPGSSQ